MISEINQADLPACARLFIEVFNSEPWNDEWTEETGIDLFQEYFNTPGFKGFAVKAEGEIIAVCFGYGRTWWDGKTFFIEEFFVRTKEQNSGIGTRFINEIEALLSRQGLSKITLLTLRDSSAERFYLKNGYENRDFLTFMRKNLV